MGVQTRVMRTGSARHDMVGQALPRALFETPEQISEGLAKRLVRHAISRLAQAGFEKAIADWDVEVYTLDGDRSSADRAYTVRFSNERRGYVEVIGIHTRRGWPTLDYGLAIGED